MKIEARYLANREISDGRKVAILETQKGPPVVFDLPIGFLPEGISQGKVIEIEITSDNEQSSGRSSSDRPQGGLHL